MEWEMHRNDDINNRNVQKRRCLTHKGCSTFDLVLHDRWVMQSWWWIFFVAALPVAEPKTAVKNDWQAPTVHSVQTAHTALPAPGQLVPAVVGSIWLDSALLLLAWAQRCSSCLGLGLAPFNLVFCLRAASPTQLCSPQGLEGIGMDGQWWESRFHRAAPSNFPEEETANCHRPQSASPWNHAPWWHNSLEQRHGHAHTSCSPTHRAQAHPSGHHVCCSGPRRCCVGGHGLRGRLGMPALMWESAQDTPESSGIPLPCASVQHGCGQNQNPQVCPKRFLCRKRHILGHTNSEILYSVWHFFLIHEVWIFYLEECYLVWELWLFLFLKWCSMKTSACNFKHITLT